MTFKGVSTDGGATAPKGKLYVGDYEARATPIADTDPATSLPLRRDSRRAPTRCSSRRRARASTRTTMTVGAGQTDEEHRGAPPNLASAANGARVIAASAGSLNAASLIDDTEATNWAGVNESALGRRRAPVRGGRPGGRRAQTIKRVNVSAMLRPGDASATDLPAAQVEDPDAGARFTALRRFGIEVCTSACDTGSATWTRIFTQLRGRLPGCGSAAAGAEPDHALVRRAGHAGRGGAPGRAGEPVHGHGGVRRGAGQRPHNATDCKAASDADLSVRAAELEVF